MTDDPSPSLARMTGRTITVTPRPVGAFVPPPRGVDIGAIREIAPADGGGARLSMYGGMVLTVVESDERVRAARDSAVAAYNEAKAAGRE